MRRLVTVLSVLILTAACGGGGGGGEPPENQAPVAAFTADPDLGTAPLVVQLDASASRDVDGTIQAMAWDLGDGGSATGTPVQHTYSSSGLYTITLTVTDDDGLTDQTTVQVLVSAPGGPPIDQSQLIPGSSVYLHDKVTESTHGSGGTQYWLFEPSTPTPASAPLIVFHHGWAVMTPDLYRAWIEHLVRRGSIVVYPRYQASIFTPPADFTPNAITAIQRAIVELGTPGRVTPDLDRAAVVGHSMGAILSANVAALAATNALPFFRAVMCVEPGTAGFSVLEDLSPIPSGTLLLSLAGDADTAVGETHAKAVFYGASNVGTDDKDYILVASDAYGTPPLVADHMAPNGGGQYPVDALDRFGFWKWLDGLVNAAWYDTHRAYALGNTAEQRYMGLWGDSTPVREPTVTDTP